MPTHIAICVRAEDGTGRGLTGHITTPSLNSFRRHIDGYSTTLTPPMGSDPPPPRTISTFVGRGFGFFTMLFTGVPADGADARVAAIWLAGLWVDHAERLDRQAVRLLDVFQNRPQRRGALRTILAHALAPLQPLHFLRRQLADV